MHSFISLGVLISRDLSWAANTTATVKKAQQRLNFLRVLRRNNTERKLLVAVQQATIESILTYCLTAWYADCSPAERKAMQRVFKSA